MGLEPFLPGFQFSGLWTSTCRFPRLRAFLPCLSPSSSWWYQSCAELCLGCSGVMLGHSCISLHHMALCSLDLFVLQPSGAREESSRASGSTGDGEQLESTHQMYSTCLHVPLQDFFGGKFHCALHLHVPSQVSGLTAISAHTFGCCLLGYVILLPVELMCTGGWISGRPKLTQ